MKYTSYKVQNIVESPIRKMYNLANKLENVISFTVGEPDFTTSSNIVNSAIMALHSGQTHYTPNAGIQPLREAIAKNVESSHGFKIDPESEVIIGNGAMQVLMLLMTAIINPEDEVIVTNPYWPNHVEQIKLCGGKPIFVTVTENNGFMYNPADVKKVLGPKTKAIILNSPANPTGAIVTRETLATLATMATENNLLIIADEVYRHFIYDSARFLSIATFPGMRERTILVDSFSKTYAMTGWRVGWAVGPQEIIRSMIKLQENFSACVNTAAQYAAIEALQGSQIPLNNMIIEYSERRQLLLDGINQIDRLSCIKPMGAFYSFVNIRQSGLSSEDFSLRLLSDQGVAVVPGNGFGSAGEGFIRLSYATSKENILIGLNRIKAFLKRI